MRITCRSVGRGRAHRWWILLLGALLTAGPLTVAAPAHAAVTGGRVVAWGSNSDGQTTVPPGLTGITAVAGGAWHSLALKNDGTVVAWGLNDWISHQTEVPAGLTGVTAIAAGDDHSLALKADGTVVAWGNNGFAQTDVPDGLTGVTAIAGGAYHSLALKSDGTVVAWGANGYGEADVPDGLTGVTAIAGGAYHSLALKSDGTVVAWGANDSGQLDVPAGLTGVIAIAGGDAHSLALKGDGTVVAWGDNTAGQLDVPTKATGVIAIAAGFDHSLALKSHGTVVAWGSNGAAQADVPANLKGVVAISAGSYHSLAVRQLPPQPDLLISRKRSSQYLGDNIYNTTAAKQTEHATLERGKTKTFYVQVANDGDAEGTFTVKAKRPAAKSTVRYYYGGKNITAEIRSGSGWQPTLAPDAVTTLTVQVTVAKSATVDSRKSAKVTASWVGTTTLRDAVRAVVVVRR